MQRACQSLRCSMPQQRPLGCCSSPLLRSRGRIVVRFEGREAIQQLQEGQAQLQEQVAEVILQLRNLQPPAPQPPAAGGPAAPPPPPASVAQPPSLEVTLELIQRDLSSMKGDIKALDSSIKALDDKVDSKVEKLESSIKAVDNKVVGLMVAVGVIGTLMGIKVFTQLRN